MKVYTKIVKSMVALATLTILLVSATVATGIAAEAPDYGDLFISADNKTVSPGGTVTVTVGITDYPKDTSPIKGVQVEIPLNSENFALVQGSESLIWNVSDTDVSRIFYDGDRQKLVVIYVSMSNESAIPFETKNFFQFDIKTNKDFNGIVEIAPDVALISDTEYVYRCEDFPVLTITVSDAPAVSLGDVNSNGRIDIADALDIFKHIAGKQLLTAQASVCADADKNGNVSIGDALAIFKHIAGKELISG